MNKSWRKEDGLDKKGFTLIELIVTIGLLAILLAMVF
ncbi:MAG: type II secretion system protein [Tissierellales bacterium]|nr:type II secretion system protein [Tissierellales bacterium]